MYNIIFKFLSRVAPRKSWRKKYHDCLWGIIIDNGKNNIVEIIAPDGTTRRPKYIPRIKIKMTGDNNHIKLYEPLGRPYIDIDISDNVNITLYPSTHYRHITVLKENKSHTTSVNNLTIGRDFSCNDMSLDFCHGDGDVTIGDDCMFSWNIIMRTGDYHTIIDTQTNEMTNPNGNITIGNHVWVGSDVMILKNTNIPDNTIIGTRALVNKNFTEPNTIIAGTPAKIIKQNKTWVREHPYQYAEQNTVK